MEANREGSEDAHLLKQSSSDWCLQTLTLLQTFTTYFYIDNYSVSFHQLHHQGVLLLKCCWYSPGANEYTFSTADSLFHNL